MNSTIKPLILCVDDDEVTRRLLERLLKNAGFDVIAAKSGMEALAGVGRKKPDIILLDIMMPEMDGYEVCSKLQENDETSYIPVIFITALEEEQDKARAFTVGATDYLVKPIKKDDLMQKIRKHIKTDIQWKELREDAGVWYEKLLPSEFIQFKEFLFTQLSTGPEQRYKFSNISPQKIYSISRAAGINNNNIAQYIAEFLKLTYISNINHGDIRMGVLPAAYCRSNHVVPVSDASGKKAFVLSNPFDWDLMDSLMKLSEFDKRSGLMITEPDNIDLLFEDDKTIQPTTISPIKERRKAARPVALRTAELPESEIKEKPVVHISNILLDRAVKERVSDIHIEPKEVDTVVRFRVDGDLRDIITVKKETGIRLISRYKVIGGLDITEKRKPQDGAFAAVIDERTFNFRISTTSTPNGESLVMRMLDPYVKAIPLTELGMADKQADTLVGCANRNAGLILIVGGTGSGKTTTVYSLLSRIDIKIRSLMSVEDPVEYRIPLANQQQVNEKAGVTFDALIKASVRQDPDILYMGEIRDNYSAKMGINFASTGHLTITTLHSSNATTAIFRMERLGVDRGIMADTILAVVAQGLLKKLCRHCKEVVPISQEEVEMLSPFTDDIPSMVAHPVGCPKCNNTGYYGREGFYEVLSFDPEISEMVRAGLTIAEIRAFAHKRGDYLISDHALEKMRKHLFAPKDIYNKVLAEEIDFKKLPSEKASAKITQPEPAVSKAATPKLKTEGPPSILIVEDDNLTQKLIIRLLENRGYRVAIAGDGIEALLYLGKKEFDLIISDINMPNLDGFKLLEMMGQKGIETPVIFMTSRIDPEDEAMGFKLGAMDYIKKPIQKEILLLRVERALGVK
jgi:type II secretory ATPase GspE/PulE/Tfp pilus assembly ATPase PilB-like protein/CheY-like chemotaxis protein